MNGISSTDLYEGWACCVKHALCVDSGRKNRSAIRRASGRISAATVMFGNFVVRGPSPGRAWTFSELGFQRRAQSRDGRIDGTAALGTLASHGIATGTDVVLAQQVRACQTQLALVVELPYRI